jgi:hypothetical protein
MNNSTSVNNTVPIEETLYISNDGSSYSTLNQINIDPININYFILNTPYCIETFSITNPYNLTFKINIGNFIFPNFTNDTSNGVATFVLSEYNNIIPHTGDDLYIDNNLYKRIQIVYNKNYNTQLYKYEDLTITGFEVVDNIKVPINKVLRLYYTTFTLPLKAPTDSIDIYGNCIVDDYILSNNTYQIQLSLNNSIYSLINLTPNDDNKLLRIKFSNLDGTYPSGNENNYLSTSINSNTINCSQLQNIDIIFVNFKPLKFLQNVYTAYSYPDRKPIFTY